MLTSNVEGSNVRGSKVGVEDGSTVELGVGFGIDVEGKLENGRERDESAELVIWLLLAPPVILVEEVKANVEVGDTFFPVSMIVPTPPSVDSCPATETPSSSSSPPNRLSLSSSSSVKLPDAESAGVAGDGEDGENDLYDEEDRE